MSSSCAEKREKKVSREEIQAMASAMMMMALADEKVIRESAEQVEATALAADPAAYMDKWLYVGSRVDWIQGEDGGPLSNQAPTPGAMQVFWLDGPIALQVTEDEATHPREGDSVRAYGRVVTATVKGMGLSDAGQQQLTSMGGPSSGTVAVFLAKWVE